MKIFWRKFNMLLFICVMFIFHVKLTDSQVLNLYTTSLTGDPCKLTCKTPDVLQTILFIKLPASGTQEGGCSGGVCGATSGRTRYAVTQDSTSMETYLDISSLVYAEDDSQWVCDYGTARSPAVNLTVISNTTVVQFTPDPATAILSQLLVMEAYCVYPVSSLTAKLVYQDGQTNNTLDMTYPVSTTAGTNGCDAHEFTVTGSYQLTPTTLSGKSVRFWIEVTFAGQVIGSALTTQTFVFQASSSSSNCDLCTPTNVLAALGIVVVVVCVALCWIMYFKFRGKLQDLDSALIKSKSDRGKFECSVTWCFRATIIAIVVLVIGLCIGGVIICVTCDDSVSSSNSVTVAIVLAAVGFVLAAVILVIVIILVILFCCGQTINHVSVKNNDPLTLTCLAGDLATTLTWTGPGGILYVTGTTVQAGLSDTIKSRISASHTKGSYKLTFTEFRSSDKGTYTSTVDETVVKHEVIVQDNSPNLGDDTTEECVAMNSDPLLEEKANNPI